MMGPTLGQVEGVARVAERGLRATAAADVLEQQRRTHRFCTWGGCIRHRCGTTVCNENSSLARVTRCVLGTTRSSALQALHLVLWCRCVGSLNSVPLCCCFPRPGRSTSE
ncbi:unnamed protein product, partial [Ectocarpus sp. 12 AP-2014]